MTRWKTSRRRRRDAGIPIFRADRIAGCVTRISVAGIYWRRDTRVAGMVLLNPWVRSEASIGRTRIKHYYARRLFEKDFWSKFVRGRVDASKGIHEVIADFLAARQTKTASLAGGSTFQDQMATGLRTFGGPVLVILSGRDLTAKEFLDYRASNPQWRGLLDRASVSRHDMNDADHTFSSDPWRWEVEDACSFLASSLVRLRARVRSRRQWLNAAITSIAVFALMPPAPGANLAMAETLLSAAGKQNAADAAKPRVIQVGRDHAIKRIADAARRARSGDMIEVEAGVYAGDVASWRQNNLTIRAVGGRARLIQTGGSAEGKAIWVIKGDNVLVENFEFAGARAPGRNGAGIRHEGGRLTVRNCLFEGNEMGLLTWNDERATLIVENSEFRNNAVAADYHRGDPIGHQIYVGTIGMFKMTDSYIHHGASVTWSNREREKA
jgi:hypothetical protein